MKFLISLLLMALLSFAACLFLPWWSIAIACFIVSMLIPQSPGRAFATGFLALFLLWGGLSFWISNNNGHLLAQKISLLLFQVGNPYLLMIATAFIGAIVAACASMSGSFLIKRREVKSIRN